MKASSGIRILLFFTIVSLVVALGCDDDDSITITETSSVFYGKITDSISGEPIDSARIRVGDTIGDPPEPWYSDSTGYYRVVIFGSQARLSVQKSGYITHSRWVEARGKDSLNVNFELVSE